MSNLKSLGFEKLSKTTTYKTPKTPKELADKKELIR